jgi:hypothetical protein
MSRWANEACYIHDIRNGAEPHLLDLGLQFLRQAHTRIVSSRPMRLLRTVRQRASS